MTAATYVGSASGGAAATTLTAAAPTGVVSGDHQLAIVCLEITGETVTGVPAGWTLLMRVDNSLNTGDTMATAVYTSTTATGSSTWTKDGTRSGWVVRLAWRGGNGINATTDVGETRAAATSVALPSITTVQPDSLVIGVIHVDDELGAASTFTPPAGWTERFDASEVFGGERHSVGVFEITRAAAGAQTGTVGHSRSMRSTVYGIALDGTPTQTVSPTAIPTGETFGTPTVAVGSVTVAPTAIPSGEAFGTATLQLTVTPTAIDSGEAFGSPTVNVVGIITPAGIPSGEAFGTPGISPQHVSPAGIGSGETFGTPSLTLTVTPSGIASAEAFGSPTVNLIIYPAAIPTGEVFGVATVSPGPVAVSPTGIDSGEQFGQPDVFITLDPTERIRPVRVRLVPLYEVVVVGRVPAQAGPPTFLEVDPIDWSKITWSSTLSRPQRLSVTCKTSTITEPIAQRLRNPDRLPTELWVSRNGRRVFAGPLLGGARNGDELTLECGGLLTYLQWMIVNADLRFDQIDQFAITTALIDQWQNLEFGHFGIDTTSVGASGVLRDRSYVRNEIHQVARRVEELGAVRDGFDAEIDPTTRKLQLWYPGKGVDRSVGDDAIVFDGRNIDDQNAMFSIGPADLASHAFGSGSRSGGDSTLWSEQFNADLRAAFGRAAFTAAFSDVELQGTLDDHVGALLDARDQPLRAPGQKVRVPVDADLDAYDVGDTVSYELDDLLGIGGAWRIRSRTVNVETTGSEAVDLEFI